MDSKGPKKLNQLPDDELKYVKSRYPTVTPKDVVSGKVTKQPDNYSCGIYACTFAVSIILRENPYEINFSTDVNVMRNHFLQIIKSGKLTTFPRQQ